MKILMATDGSVHASTAMLTATRLLGGKPTKVDVLSVGPELATYLAGGGARGHREYEKKVTGQTQKTLRAAQSILAQLHVKTHGVVEFGSPADQLLKLSPTYDLIVVGAYGVHDRKQPGLGPVASRVLQQGSGNLMIGRELVNESNFRVLVALDSSKASFTALEVLPSLFDSTSLEVTLMHVVEMSWAAPTSVASQDEEIDLSDLGEYERQLGRQLRQTANIVMENALRRLEHWSIPASSIISEGDPALELCSEAERGGYDLVVAGATGTSDVKHALLGSVSLKLAWDAPTSVAIIRQAIS
ncbi:MAG TPA: universal stress protein [Terriglobia bacterium]|nr:universal stress protein [Terriglobia bacterium]